MDLFQSGTSYFEERTLSGISLTGKTLENKEFEKCRFVKCIFIETSFIKCHFIDCTFTDCSISAPKFTNSMFTNTVFQNSKVMGADWTKTKNVRLLTFENCDIRYSNFSYMKLPHLIIRESMAHECNFADADLNEGIFTKTDFQQSVFSNTTLVKADFRKAINYGIDINFNKIKKARFSLPEATSLLKSFDIELE